MPELFESKNIKRTAVLWSVLIIGCFHLILENFDKAETIVQKEKSPISIKAKTDEIKKKALAIIEKKVQENIPFPETKKSAWDDNPDFFKPYPNGNYSQAESARRIETPQPGITLFKDIGVTFYKVIA